MQIEKIRYYIRAWKARGYPDGLPDEVPEVLMAELMAPSYRAICLAILKNDHSLESLGFQPRYRKATMKAVREVVVPERQLELCSIDGRESWEEPSVSQIHMRARGAEILDFESAKRICRCEGEACAHE